MRELTQLSPTWSNAIWMISKDAFSSSLWEEVDNDGKIFFSLTQTKTIHDKVFHENVDAERDSSNDLFNFLHGTLIYATTSHKFNNFHLEFLYFIHKHSQFTSKKISSELFLCMRFSFCRRRCCRVTLAGANFHKAFHCSPIFVPNETELFPERSENSSYEKKLYCSSCFSLTKYKSILLLAHELFTFGRNSLLARYWNSVFSILPSSPLST